MTAVERDVLAALRELEAAVVRMRNENPKPDLRPLFAQLDTLATRLPKETDPSLLHYLHRKSYEKARQFLEGHDAENQTGTCRH